MERLEEHELINGGLLRVEEPYLVERYNQALKGFGLPDTKLDSFQIDMVGYSPEIAEEFGDNFYLDPKSINRRFVIISPEQVHLPVIQTAFSNTGLLMHQFFEQNAKVIKILTIKDVLYGEIEDSILEAKDIEDLLSIEQVEFKVFTANDLTSQAAELRTLVDRLKKEPDVWRDDNLLERMVELAKSTGDIRTNQLVPDEVIFRHNTFWTRHFGGLYIFIDDNQTTVIGNPSAPGFKRSRPWQVSYLDARDEELIYQFLLDTGRVDVPRGSWIERAEFIEHRAEMLVTSISAQISPNEKPKSDRRWIKSFVNRHTDVFEEEGTLPFLNWAQRELANWSRIELEEIDARGRFLLSRAKPGHPDQWLVNRLIADYVPFDFMTRFVFNKPAFYRDYQKWPDKYRDYVVKRVSEDYFSDKAAYRSKLFDL